MMLAWEIGTLILVLRIDGDNATTIGGSLAPDTTDASAVAQSIRVVANGIFEDCGSSKSQRFSYLKNSRRSLVLNLGVIILHGI